MKKNKKGLRLIIVLLLIAIMTSAVTVLSYYVYTGYHVLETPIDLRVSDYVGVNNDVDAIHLGTTLPGRTPERQITFISDKRKRLSLTVIGLDFVYPNTEELILEPHTPAVVTIYALIPEDAVYGLYEGVLHVTSRRF